MSTVSHLAQQPSASKVEPCCF